MKSKKAASTIDHTVDGAPDEKNNHNTSKADRSNSSDSDSDYTPNEYSSGSEVSVSIACILFFFFKVLGAKSGEVNLFELTLYSS